MRCMLFSALTILAFCLCIPPARADNLIQGLQWNVYQPGADYVSLANRDVEVDGRSVTALVITVTKPTDPFYQMGAAIDIPVAIVENTRIRLRFRARSETHNPMRAVIEKNGAPYTAVAGTTPTLGPEWKLFTIQGVSPAYEPNGLSVKFQFGQQVGSIEIADIVLEDIGPDPAFAAARPLLAPEAVQSRIRKYRTGMLTVVARDAKGRVVPGVKVHLAQIRHAFLFGCNIFTLNPDNTEDWQLEYQKRYTALFNYGTLPFYWGAFEPEAGKPQYERLEKMAKWCAAHGITTKGHPLVWHEVYPAWAPKDTDEAIPLLHKRVADIVPHFKGLIHYWDVLNEANGAAAFANGEGAWIKRDGPAKVVQTALSWARAAGAGTNETFLYNDYETGPDNVALLTALQAQHALPDAVGIQSHMHGGVWPLEKVWVTADTFGKFGKPVHFTEVTVLSGPKRDNVDQNNPPHDWLTTPEEEQKQADYVEKFYSTLFSHPSMRAITWWDFSDRDSWQNAPSGFLRRDMSPKPVYDRLMRLIHHDWWTDTAGAASAKGAFQARAFYGDYKVTVTDKKGRTATRSFTFPMGAGAKTVTVPLP